ncbi:cytochrome P450 CYP94D109-like [Curcuma longa]|uniref:cytochrome P450 CYP94D109-like n=1 Tax=Curcuma longa TaxID=136217 RepID=UPI003D9E0FF9
MGRMQALWGADFEEFEKPERWLEAETGAFRPREPFQSIAACVLERFVVEGKEAHPPEVMATLTLKMKGGLPVHVRLRENSS